MCTTLLASGQLTACSSGFEILSIMCPTHNRVVVVVFRVPQPKCVNVAIDCDREIERIHSLFLINLDKLDELQSKCFFHFLGPGQTINVWRPNTIKHCLVNKHFTVWTPCTPQRLVSIVSSVFDQTCFNRLATHFNISIFGHQTMFDGVWSPNIYRFSRPLFKMPYPPVHINDTQYFKT